MNLLSWFRRKSQQKKNTQSAGYSSNPDVTPVIDQTVMTYLPLVDGSPTYSDPSPSYSDTSSSVDTSYSTSGGDF